MSDECAGQPARADDVQIDVCQGDNRGPVPRALRHGVYAETLLPDEDVTQFEALRAGLLRSSLPPARSRKTSSPRSRAPDLAQAESREVSGARNDELQQPHEQPRS